MNKRWQFTKRRLQNNWRAWKAEHLTRSKIAVFLITVLIFILAVPLLIYIALNNDAQQLMLSNVSQIEPNSVVVVYGLDPALDSVGLRQQIFSRIPEIGLALERGQISSLVLASPQKVQNPAKLELKQGSLAILPNVNNAWDFCLQMKSLISPSTVVVADGIDIPQVAFVCKNFALDISMLQVDLYPTVARSGLWFRSLLELTSLVWRVNYSTIALYE